MRKYINDLDILNEVKIELDRFVTKLKEAIDEQSLPQNYSQKKFASVKRSAMDLKNELTKLTQTGKYKYSD